MAIDEPLRERLWEEVNAFWVRNWVNVVWWVKQVEQTPLPLLFMRTVIQAVGAFPTLVFLSPFSYWWHGIVEVYAAAACLYLFIESLFLLVRSTRDLSWVLWKKDFVEGCAPNSVQSRYRILGKSGNKFYAPLQHTEEGNAKGFSLYAGELCDGDSLSSCE